jgi:GrpB-like predicted nucleotidyltransferase (UPF0157 family)
MNGSVVIVDYNPDWPRIYEEESARVREAAPLADVGYKDVTPQPPEEKEWYYCLGRHPAEGRGYHVHLMQYPSACWDRHVLFRDYLRSRADIAREYERLKRELAVRFRDDRPRYTEAKDDFIEKTLARARKEMEDKKP